MDGQTLEGEFKVLMDSVRMEEGGMDDGGIGHHSNDTGCKLNWRLWIGDSIGTASHHPPHWRCGSLRGVSFPVLECRYSGPPVLSSPLEVTGGWM